ncbi:PGPGW domain-containing protein [Ningiella sp. W23]|uniref:PGPGW domain-containing protein n=1 Tax=Ningiella sp. W23 TaxID=3023715 RepID=UPI003756B07A
MKKTIRTTAGASLVGLGALFILIPGPSLIFLIPGLMLLSFDYPLARSWLKKCQKFASQSARWLDSKITRRRYFR